VLGYALLVDEGAARALFVENPVVATFLDDGGMDSGDSSVVTESKISLLRRTTKTHFNYIKIDPTWGLACGLQHFQKRGRTRLSFSSLVKTVDIRRITTNLSLGISYTVT
jgi:hypothetical protein